MAKVTAVELADIAGIEANTVRKIAAELLEMLRNDMENKGLTGVENEWS